MKIGLIDVDSHNFPNLALMRISAYWKSKGAEVEWWLGDLFHYDIIYKSKVFSDAYSKDIPDPVNCDKLIKGGTGYAIKLVGGVLKNTIKHMTENSPRKLKPANLIIPYTLNMIFALP